ncbi:MAG: Phosphoribosylglycinamide formyltransferase [Nitrospirae bacterium]|mgnify:CR=1 FL=1|nr:MAG: phosphoribosylglycinamide formyltransferase [Nitrospira sp. OLB3]MBV6468637.1 Phosphoribosylglycinamide formyltransferase [Nitrospirota bacterium]MCE7963974.1 phosphoribosylglycinamide formyltransferase [Nitrospira sp. NTP2]MCK6494602.1 phosphoribosylglycinamide formyltransferase [Nitrospira sp.]MEB2337178.1 phosphoribosylglycinamide formyltransferase [Nitrospirales bacterium]
MSAESPRLLRLAVLLSGRGSNLQAIIDAIEGGTLSAEIAVVLSNKQDAAGLERARKHGVTALWLDPKPFAGRPDSREAYDRAVLEILQKYEVDLVLLAGYMKIVTGVLVKTYENRMMNIHPSLLPSFPGLDVQKKAIEHGCKIAGCTVHFVTEGVDEGPIIIQAAVPVLEGDTPDRLAARILEQEHQVYPRAIQLYAEGRLKVEGRRVTVAGIGEATTGFRYPT